jgi:DNA-binding transcriptional MerR regulator
MKYKIGNVARILGISTDLLRYYEKKGVVTPTKDKYNDYRYYDAWDINFLMDCLWFKNFGFSIEQIADMVRIPSIDDIIDMFEYKEDELRSTIRHCELLLQRSEQHRDEIGRIDSLLHKCEIAYSPEVIRYLNRVGDEYPSGEQFETLSRQWLAYMPFNSRYFEISESALMAGDDEGYRWGFSLDTDYVQKLDFNPRPPILRKPSRKSIHTIFKSQGKGGFSAKLLRYALDYAEENDLKIAGPAQGILLVSILEEPELCGFFETWIPIE